ncbi:hypothetical protein ABIE67_009106 [Streptomyces sp. V4I8]|uniref:hypothetical protein n=1 Tax=Streptomyces sp. V4I8 TaxID=3156469 RepID=UPI003512036E
MLLHVVVRGSAAQVGDLVERYGAPPALTRVLATGVRPGSIDRHEVFTLLGARQFTVLTEFDTAIHTTYHLPTGERAQEPAYLMALMVPRTLP